MIQDNYKKPTGYTQCAEIQSAEVSSGKRQRLPLVRVHCRAVGTIRRCAEARRHTQSVKLRSPAVQELCSDVELRLTKLSESGTE